MGVGNKFYGKSIPKGSKLCYRQDNYSIFGFIAPAYCSILSLSLHTPLVLRGAIPHFNGKFWSMVILAISPSKDIRHGLHDEEAYVAHVDPEPPLQKLVSFLLSSSLIVAC